MTSDTALTGSPARPRPPARSAGERRRARAAYLFLAPFFVVFLAMLVIPLGYSGYLSLFRTRLIGGTSFVGAQNYLTALTDPEFLAGVGRMGLFLLVQVPVMLGGALFLALALDSGRARGAGVLRLLYFVPYAVPGVVATMMWGYLYGRDFGPLAQVFRAFGASAPDVLAPGTVLGSMMNIVTWEFVGYNMIIMYSALRTIPAELLEAASIDGAGLVRQAWSIKIPAIGPAIVLTVIFSIIGTFQLFNEPALLKGIAPTAISNGFTPNFYAYNLAFVNQDVNYAAAVAFLLGLVIAVISYLVQLRVNRGGTAN
ncbi:sugar ABC transporter permease [Kineococcus sp. NBC_00420]|uniref:carbohydrate ABC transporter permease n=1 Tax=Kineococcus sp. NBC_00420 TaxID=2903564 RepID=UPI002E21E244